MRFPLTIALAIFLPVAAHANANNAQSMCNWVDSLKLFSGPCAVSVQSKVVVVKLQGSKNEARKICASLTGAMRNDAVQFDNGWRLQLTDPTKGNAQSAICDL